MIDSTLVAREEKVFFFQLQFPVLLLLHPLFKSLAIPPIFLRFIKDNESFATILSGKSIQAEPVVQKGIEA